MQILILVALAIYKTRAAFSPQDILGNYYSNHLNNVQDGYSKFNFSQDYYDNYGENFETDEDMVQQPSIFDVRTKV